MSSETLKALSECPDCERLRAVAEAALAYRRALRDSPRLDDAVEALMALDKAVEDYAEGKHG